MSSELEASPEELLERLREGLPLRPLGEVRRAKAEFERMLSGLQQEHPESAEVSYAGPMDATRPLDQIRFYEQAIEICNLQISSRGRQSPSLSEKLAKLEKRRDALLIAYPWLKKIRRTLDPLPPQVEYDKLREQIAKIKLRIGVTAPAIQKPATLPAKEHDLLNTRPDIASRRSIIRRNPGMSYQKLCAQFDSEKVALPDSWQDKYGVSDWQHAYRKPETRKLIQPLISKERSKLSTNKKNG